MQNIDQADDLFVKLASGLTRKVDFANFPDSIFFFKGSELFFEYDLGIFLLHARVNEAYDQFKEKGIVGYVQIEQFMTNKARSYLNMSNVAYTPVTSNRVYQVEMHFQNKW